MVSIYMFITPTHENMLLPSRHFSNAILHRCVKHLLILHVYTWTDIFLKMCNVIAFIFVCKVFDRKILMDFSEFNQKLQTVSKYKYLLKFYNIFIKCSVISLGLRRKCRSKRKCVGLNGFVISWRSYFIFIKYACINVVSLFA